MLRLGEEVHLGEALLRLGREVRLGGALLHLGGLEGSANLGSGSPRRSSTPRRRGCRAEAEMARFGHFHRKFPSNPKPTQPKTQNKP